MCYNKGMEKKRLGRPPGSLSRNRKGAATITLRLAQDCREIVESLVPQAYATRTAAVEALIRIASNRIREIGVRP